MSNDLLPGIAKGSKGHLHQRSKNPLSSGIEHLLRENRMQRGIGYLNSLLNLHIPSNIGTDTNILKLTSQGELCVLEKDLAATNAKLSELEDRLSIVETKLDDALAPGGGLS